jgi:dipeptidyl aminopeptidase/acylaminoacyl peptidase
MRRVALHLPLLLILVVCPQVSADGKRPMVIEDLFRFKRVADPQISPDGKQVAYTLTTVDLAGNKTEIAIWLAPTEKGAPHALTNSGKHDRHPRWSPDSKRILFESDRSGESQLWVIDVYGGEARQLTTTASEASDAIWSPDGRSIAFVSAVYPEYSSKPFSESNGLNKKRNEDAAKNPVKARVFKGLFYRHWDHWVEDKRQHLFVMPAAGGEPKDVTPGDRDAFPTSDTFSTGDNFTFSTDSRYLVFTAVPAKNEAWSTNYDICRVPITGGSEDWECLTSDNKAADSGPVFSPDGKWLAYRAQKRPGFEADKWELMIVACDKSGGVREKPRSLTAQLDRSVSELTWSPDEGGSPLSPADKPRIFYSAEERANTVYFIANIDPLDSYHVVYNDLPYRGVESGLTISSDGKEHAYLRASLQQPAEVYATGATQAFAQPGASKGAYQVVNVSQANRQLLAELQMPRPDYAMVEGSGGTPMQMWILKPPSFEASKKWPLVYLVHGGPQGAWENGWSYRWNPELWAAQGYVVALPNPRGSTGFGQKYVDEISGDWGGKCFDDLMAGLAYLERQPYIDTDRMAAAGASFGGYMMDWFEGHTDKFKTLITHCGVYNFDSMYATTDEIWFDEWEHGGPPWKNRESYEKFSPHRYAKNFKTPMLIIHNDRDFRVPVDQGLQLFNTLQRMGIASKMINFPDEGHWVLKPANSAYWHREVFAWLKKYAPPGGR